MKTKILLWLALIVKYASLLAGLGALPQLALLPPEWMAYATLGFALASLLKDTCNRIGDLLDDGKINQSFGKGTHLLLLFLLPVLTLPACVGGSSSNGSESSGGQVSTAPRTLLGVSAAGWQHIASQAAAGALQGALQGAATTYARQLTSAKAVHDPQP